ncbi:hypothetical protein F4553_005612 [Allocatelliglobosispora scoriae]|uniref:Uncharacterized protein n=1 Tax=Allocatelliglobosispora scoriae TaxID=643052 RepID=A0A841BXF1_9ACTN|nr:hypothetical protein [Allocatelliglobosispora scoriae]MBB5872178.1 hypothetical protein [Allocatelliglobosispora scoriae]
MSTTLRWGLGLGIVAALALAAPAAAGGPTAPAAADLTAASRAAAAPATITALGRFFAATGAGATSGTGLAAPAGTAAPTLGGAPIAVYSLNPAFVRSGSAPVAVLQYVATTATSADGRSASVWAAPSATGWSVVNIASGNDEARYAAAAGSGAVLFQEPQINGWYALRGDRVVPLNADARSAVGTGMAVADYQRLVHDRYADKQPGSAYEKSGTAGGYAPSAPSSPLPLIAVLATAALGLIGLPRLRRR